MHVSLIDLTLCCFFHCVSSGWFGVLTLKKVGSCLLLMRSRAGLYLLIFRNKFSRSSLLKRLFAQLVGSRSDYWLSAFLITACWDLITFSKRRQGIISVPSK